MPRIPYRSGHTCLVLCMAGFMAGLPAALAQSGAEAGEGGTRFDIWEFQVTGNSVIDVRQIERAVYPFLGPDRTIDDVDAARESLEVLYREAGYATVVVNIPEQNVEAGMVQFDVVEGRVGRLRVSGAEYFSPRRIKDHVPSLAPGEVLYLPDVQEDLTALNRVSRDRRITPVLRPGRDPGTVEVELKVDDNRPLHGFVEVNDRYSQDTTRTRINSSLNWANLWQREHTLGIGFTTAPDNTDDVKAYYGTYTFNLGKWINTGYAVKTDSDVASVGTEGVVGSGKIFGYRATRPLGLWKGAFHTLTMGMDYKDFDEDVTLLGNVLQLETPIDYWIASAGYSGSLGDDKAFTRLGLDAVIAPRFFGNNEENFATKRFGARGNFAYLKLNVFHRRELWGGFQWQTTLKGQLSDSPMISNEQFTVGGVESVRGYLESEEFVDDGLSGQVEFLTPDMGAKLFPDQLSTRLVAFVDAGGGWIQKPLPELDADFFLWSAGAGLRVALWR